MVEAELLLQILTMTTAPRLSIDLTALARNWQALAALCPQSETSAVVKANAYGLGIEEVVPVLHDAGCRTFFVAMVEEGIRVRQASPNARVIVLNGIFRDTVDAVGAFDLVPVLSTKDQIALWAKANQEVGKIRDSALHVDTGMNRLGLSLKEAKAIAKDPAMVANCGARLLMSHLACADEPDHPLNHLQQDRFKGVIKRFEGLKYSLANSAAILADPANLFDLTRPGIAIYGGEAINGIENPMEPVVVAETRVLQIRNASKDDSVGYGAARILERDTKIAVCSSGYADGFHRASSGDGVPLRSEQNSGGFGAIGGHRVPVIGRVSMDLTAFDVTDVPDRVLEDNEWIELFGRSISIDDAARAAGTIGYELLTGLGQRYQRTYLR